MDYHMIPFQDYCLDFVSMHMALNYDIFNIFLSICRLHNADLSRNAGTTQIVFTHYITVDTKYR